jgi:hypothetical protein
LETPKKLACVSLNTSGAACTAAIAARARASPPDVKKQSTM